MDATTVPAPAAVDSRADAEALDRTDPLALCRERFTLPDGVCYLDGNSLGALPKSVPPRLEEVIHREWGVGLVRSWNDPWIDLPPSAAAKIAPLVGAAARDLVIADSTSVNLFKLLAAGLRLQTGAGRRTILAYHHDFPTDLYVADGLCALLGGERAELRRFEGDNVREGLADDVAVLSLSHVDFKTGELRDMAAITRAAHDHGALVLWDLSHSAGVVDVDLAGCGVDLAVGCGYKYLSGGPGAPAFLYLAPRHQERARSPIQGWLGHRDYMAFEPAYRPAPGAERFSCGTWPILSLAALDAALDAFDGVDVAEVRRKSLRLGELFLARVEPLAERFPITIATPREPSRRAGHVAVRHPHGYAVMQALKSRGFVGDFRTPDLMRFGFAPLYLRHADVWDAAEALHDVLETGAWDRPEHHRRERIT